MPPLRICAPFGTYAVIFGAQILWSDIEGVYLDAEAFARSFGRVERA